MPKNHGGRTNYDLGLGGYSALLAFAIGAPLLFGSLLLMLLQYLIPVVIIILIIWAIEGLMSPPPAPPVAIEKPKSPRSLATKPKHLKKLPK